MLIDLLERIAQGGLHNPADLAVALGTSPDLLDQMLDDLVRMGYLEEVNRGCMPAACSSESASCD